MRKINEMNLRHIKQRLLVHEAKKWQGFTEQGGNNKGQAVELFQKYVDGRAVGEPWCISFIQFCVNQVDEMVDSFFAMSINHRSQLHRTEHSLTMYRMHPENLHINQPEPGTIPIWQKGLTASGHGGIVDFVLTDDRGFMSIEGNTGPGSKVEREGDGVFRKVRSLSTVGSFKLKGFLRPWDDLLLDNI